MRATRNEEARYALGLEQHAIGFLGRAWVTVCNCRIDLRTRAGVGRRKATLPS